MKYPWIEKEEELRDGVTMKTVQEFPHGPWNYTIRSTVGPTPVELVMEGLFRDWPKEGYGTYLVRWLEGDNDEVGAIVRRYDSCD